MKEMNEIEELVLKRREKVLKQEKDALEKHIVECVDKDKNGNLSVDEFKNFLIGTCIKHAKKSL